MINSNLLWAAMITLSPSFFDYFSTNSGTFRAPYNGLYTFTMFFQATGEVDTEVDIHVNGNSFCFYQSPKITGVHVYPLNRQTDRYGEFNT